jgi:hypothetical protein
MTQNPGKANGCFDKNTRSSLRKLERTQQNFAALRFFLSPTSTTFMLMFYSTYLKLHTVRKRTYHLDAQFFTQVSLGFKFCPPILETVGLRVPAGSVLQVRTVLLLEALTLLMLFVRKVTYLEPGLFLLMFYSGTFLTIKTLNYSS